MKKRFVYDKYKKMKSRIFDRFEEFSFMYVVMVKSKETKELNFQRFEMIVETIALLWKHSGKLYL